MIIPVRVPVNAPAYLVGGERTVASDHPLYGQDCPVCDGPLGEAAITLVCVGIAPEDHKESGWTTGSAVAIHAACAGPGATSEAP